MRGRVPRSLRLLDARASSDALLENCLPKSVISDALRSAEVTNSSVAKHVDERCVEHRSFEVHREVTVCATLFVSESPACVSAKQQTGGGIVFAGTICGHCQLHEALCRNDAG